MPEDARTKTKSTVVNPIKIRAFDDYITWRALGGLLLDEDDPNTPNKMRIMPLAEFCTTVGIDPKTVYRWKIGTPNLAELIEKRRNEIMPLARVSAAYNQLFMLGMQSQDKRAAVDALKTFLGQFGNLQLPTQRQEVEVGNNLMDLLNQARKKKIIEAEAVDDTGSSPSTD